MTTPHEADRIAEITKSRDRAKYDRKYVPSYDSDITFLLEYIKTIRPDADLCNDLKSIMEWDYLPERDPILDKAYQAGKQAMLKEMVAKLAASNVINSYTLMAVLKVFDPTYKEPVPTLNEQRVAEMRELAVETHNELNRLYKLQEPYRGGSNWNLTRRLYDLIQRWQPLRRGQ